ncbi:hypothetical protein RJ640_004109 [Escallonia rubra]|uniref:Alpha-carbonic anhydrase domain-containing protein n=1 Tax=Escallonia rubra TaxID=112253 RepID=A0AA88RGX3_9ASTE|nr:hypothetical protein RJ640_004109 [Escallonia rubra]
MKKLIEQSCDLGFFLSLVLVLSVASCLATCQEVEGEREFNYDEGSAKGPGHWGELRSEWSMCNSGRMQSPIDLLNERVETVSNLGKLNRDYKPSNASLINRGHDMMDSETNARPLQPTNKRSVKLYRPRVREEN